MLDKKVRDLINAQIAKEFYSGYLYLDFANFYEEKGYPIDSVIEAIMTIANSNYEQWREGHPDALFTDFEFSPKKMSVSGALFDLDKLDNISKNYLSRLKASEVFDMLDSWSKEYDKDFNELINKYKDYTISVLNIEREQKKPRKDYASLSEIKGQIWYMFDELFVNPEYHFDEKYSKDDIKEVLDTYFNKYYDVADDKDTWFEKMKSLSDELGFCSDMKLYKEDPSKYKGSVADVSNIIRVGVTTLSTTPDLYIILQLFVVTIYYYLQNYIYRYIFLFKIFLNIFFFIFFSFINCFFIVKLRIINK